MAKNSEDLRDDAEGDRALLKLAAERFQENRKVPSSKYDFVKIKVWLGENREHYYILSRFLIARMLTVTRVPQNKAVKIALEVKKWLVDNSKLNISQEDLEEALFSSMRARNFGQEYIDRFRMVNRFQQQKTPLIILVCGTACTGKSTLAQQLSARLNLPNVLSTDALSDLLRGYPGAPLPEEPLWIRKNDVSKEIDRRSPVPSPVVQEFQEECLVMRRALDGDLVKCVVDGKSIIIEGLHLDPGLYLNEFGRPKILEMVQRKKYSVDARRHDQGNACFKEEEVINTGDNGSATTFLSQRSKGFEGETIPTEDKVSKMGDCVDKAPPDAVGMEDRKTVSSHSGSPVFVPIVLKADSGDFKVLAQEWLLRRIPGGTVDAEMARESALKRLLILQEYLGEYQHAGIPVVKVGAIDQQQTLDDLHEYVLACIEHSVRNSDPKLGNES